MTNDEPTNETPEEVFAELLQRAFTPNGTSGTLAEKVRRDLLDPAHRNGENTDDNA